MSMRDQNGGTVHDLGVERGRLADSDVFLPLGLCQGAGHFIDCRAPTFADTDWRRIAEWYDTLERIAPSPLHSLNRAVAEAYLHGPQAGLERLAAVLPENVPARYPSWHAVIGELHFRLGRHCAAERAWREALRLTTARADREFLRRRLALCRPDGGEPAT